MQTTPRVEAQIESPGYFEHTNLGGLSQDRHAPHPIRQSAAASKTLSANNDYLAFAPKL